MFKLLSGSICLLLAVHDEFFYTIDLDKQASLLQAAILAGKLLEKGTRYRKALKLVCQEVYCYNEEIVSTD